MKRQDTIAARWVARNRGKMSEIAGKVTPPVTPQFVQMVLRGKRTSARGRVEDALRREGAPV